MPKNIHQHQEYQQQEFKVERDEESESQQSDDQTGMVHRLNPQPTQSRDKNKAFKIIFVLIIFLVLKNMFFSTHEKVKQKLPEITEQEKQEFISLDRPQDQLEENNEQKQQIEHKQDTSSPVNLHKEQGKQKKKQLFFLKPDPLKKKDSQILPDQVQFASHLKEYQDFPGVFQEEIQKYEEKYEISKYQEKPFCIVIPTYNNVDDQRFQKNIDSLLTQEYSNYRALIIDDASTDLTGQIIRGYLSGNPVYQEMLDNRVKIQINSQRKMALPNILDAAKNFCKPQELFMVLDGDDYLLGRQVLKLYNAIFSKNDVWLAFSNFLSVNGRSGFSREYPPQVIENNDFRRVYFGISHLRVLYTQLLLNIKDDDLRDKNGQYYRAANDVAIFMPVMQMAGKRQIYIKELCYFYNSKTGLNNHVEKKKEQRFNEMEIRMKPQYEALENLF